jgi:3-dehydroquinate synthase
MTTIELTTLTGFSRILVGAPLSDLRSLEGRVGKVIVADRHVAELYGAHFEGLTLITIETGEAQKTIATVERLYGEFLRLGLDRTSFVVAVGGGVVCDIAGFAASTYVRGMSFGFAPTTLLAQVDAALGGKNGVNVNGYKNLVGTITQPRFVLCDTETLKTLPAAEVRNGFAEVIKHALIADSGLFDLLEREAERALALTHGLLEEIICSSVMIKTAIVSRDERESGERRTLNFGHTVGHALEKVAGFSHGEAVSLGMVAAARLSEAKGLLTKGDVKRIGDILSAYGLPTETRGSKKEIIEALGKDKKRESDMIHFVLLEGIGRAKVDEIPISELGEAIDDLC